MHRLIVVCTTLVLLAAASEARPKKGRVGEAGEFAYYVLSLSWSPQYCAEKGQKSDKEQCAASRPYGFVVHGLWPQYERGFPQSCSADTKLPDRVVSDLLDIMPSRRLIRHEWEKHGTCSGLPANLYFATVRQAYNEVRIPPLYEKLAAPRKVSLAEIERHFIAANPDLTPESIAVLCNDNHLQEVRICFDRSISPRACGKDVRDRCKAPFTVRAMR